ncbi:MAG TPA: hypothetical protein VFT72_16510 [Opitutaceae bacterium]|nr:hypothetical protein [Opitutaceae bacterium]
MPWTFEELDERYAALTPSPKERGTVVQVCVRPDIDRRHFPGVLELSETRGAIGDRWERRTWIYLPDGKPDPRVQVALMNSRTLAWLQQITGAHHHPGDTLLVDFDLAESNLSNGSRLRVGTAVLEISDVVNDACAKFAAHYGADVFRWIRHAPNRSRRLRGAFARVVRSGEVKNGDAISCVLGEAE